MDRRVDLAVARLEVEVLARSYGLARSTRLIKKEGEGAIPKLTAGLKPNVPNALVLSVGRGGDPRPSLLHRRAVPPRAEVAALRAAPALRLLHRRRGGAEPTSVGAFFLNRHARPCAGHPRF